MYFAAKKLGRCQFVDRPTTAIVRAVRRIAASPGMSSMTAGDGMIKGRRVFEFEGAARYCRGLQPNLYPVAEHLRLSVPRADYRRFETAAGLTRLCAPRYNSQVVDTSNSDAPRCRVAW